MGHFSFSGAGSIRRLQEKFEGYRKARPGLAQCYNRPIHLQAGIPNGCWELSELLYFPIQHPVNGLGTKQKMTQILGPLYPHESEEEAPGSQLWTGPALAIVAIQGVTQWMGDLSLSLSNSNLQNKIYLFFLKKGKSKFLLILPQTSTFQDSFYFLFLQQTKTFCPKLREMLHFL